MDAPVKFVTLKVRNQSGRPRRLSLIGYWELVLGEWRHANLMHIVTDKDPDTGALFARNPYSRAFPSRVFFAQVSEPRRTVTGSRTEFIGRNRSLADPAALHRTRLSGRTGAALDPCAAIQTEIVLAEGQEREIVFVVGDRRRRRRGAAPDHPLRRPGRRQAGAGRCVGALEPRPRRRLRRDSRPGARRARQRLARLSDPLLPVLGPQRLLPVGRRLRLPGPAAGHAGPSPHDPLAHPRAPAALGGPPVPRGRRPALVASSRRAGSAVALVRRLSVAALRHVPVRAGDGRHGRARRACRLRRSPGLWIPRKRRRTSSPCAPRTPPLSTITACAPSPTGCGSAGTDCRSWGRATGTTG